MKESLRLTRGGVINRKKPVKFRFNGKLYSGYEGDTLASALLASNVHFVSRSFKYHRPRGIYSAGEEEPNALVEVGRDAHRVPSCRAPLVPLHDGLEARSQFGWPSLSFDLARVFDYTHPLWPAGFYNKIFKWPNWHTWEGMIRRMAGLGRALEDDDPDQYEQVNAHCDLLICGGGPAGLLAALVAGRAGIRVILAEQDKQFGGSLNWENYLLDGHSPGQWIEEVVNELASMPDVTLLSHTTVSGNYDHNVTTLVQHNDVPAAERRWRECLWTVRPRRILLATGSIEQGLIFANNDRPGILLAGSVRHYLNRYAVAAGRRAVIATNNDTAYQTAFDLKASGLTVKAVVDSRSEINEQLVQRLKQLGIPVYAGARIRDTRGGRRITSLSIESLSGERRALKRCDLLAISGGWSPRVHLFCHARGKLRFDPVSQSFLPDQARPGMRVIGSASGLADLSEILSDAVENSMEICAALGKRAHHAHRPMVTQRIVESRNVHQVPIKSTARRQWIDLAHDVTASDAELAVREGYESVEHFKRYTTTGMSIDQGKTGNLNAFIALSTLTGKPISDIGTTTFRPPYMPVTLGTIAGRSRGDFYQPRRYLPAHRIHGFLGARFEDYGGWQRPEFYPRSGESARQAIEREASAVRKSVGVFDNSPIGKIEVKGPDAAEFLNRMYINNVLSLKVGRCRYGLMLNENGVIIDDGIFTLLAENHFLVNTTSGGVARIFSQFEEWLQCEWPELDVLLHDVTEQWANFTVAGPGARQLLQSLGTDIDLSAQALPHLAVATGQSGGENVRLIRVSFSGEQSFEVNLRADRAAHWLARLLQHGEKLGLTPYGIEALMLLRLEKGYLHVGSDTDGETTPDDVGWGRIARQKQSDYLGRRSLFRPANESAQRKQLIGLIAMNVEQVIKPGGHLLMGENRQAPENTDGWITSAAYSPHVGRYIALGMLRAGQDKQDEVVTVIDSAGSFHARVCPVTFIDPDNQRLAT